MISKLRNALDSKKISTTELILELQKKCEEKKEYNCFITTDLDYAKKQAESAQKLILENRASSLTGIPIAVKDNILTKGIKTTCASRMLKDFIPNFDATVIEKLNAEGFILSGKTNLDEFSMGNSGENSYFGRVLNPFDKEKVSGGSSSGSAASVALGLSPAALGSDTGGSVRQPASFCGVFGLKPTYGKVSRYGLISFASSLEQIGILGTCALDTMLVLNTISCKDKRDLTSLSSDKCEIKNVQGKIGLIKEFFDFSDPEVSKAVENASRQFEKLGFLVSYCSLESLKYAVSAYYVISSAEAASNLSRFDGIKYGLRENGESFEEIILNSRTKGFGDEVKRRIMLGNYVLSEGFYEKFYLRAKSVQNKLKSEFSELFKTYDFLITPTAPNLPKKAGEKTSPSENYNADILTVTQNLTGLPCISVPCTSVSGLPVGMTITGKAFTESEIISLADLFERRFLI